MNIPLPRRLKMTKARFCDMQPTVELERIEIPPTAAGVLMQPGCSNIKKKHTPDKEENSPNSDGQPVTNDKENGPRRSFVVKRKKYQLTSSSSEDSDGVGYRPYITTNRRQQESDSPPEYGLKSLKTSKTKVSKRVESKSRMEKHSAKEADLDSDFQDMSDEPLTKSSLKKPTSVANKRRRLATSSDETDDSNLEETLIERSPSSRRSNSDSLSNASSLNQKEKLDLKKGIKKLLATEDLDSDVQDMSDEPLKISSLKKVTAVAKKRSRLAISSDEADDSNQEETSIERSPGSMRSNTDSLSKASTLNRKEKSDSKKGIIKKEVSSESDEQDMSDEPLSKMKKWSPKVAKSASKKNSLFSSSDETDKEDLKEILKKERSPGSMNSNTDSLSKANTLNQKEQSDSKKGIKKEESSESDEQDMSDEPLSKMKKWSPKVAKSASKKNSLFSSSDETDKEDLKEILKKERSPGPIRSNSDSSTTSSLNMQGKKTDSEDEIKKSLEMKLSSVTEPERTTTSNKEISSLISSSGSDTDQKENMDSLNRNSQNKKRINKCSESGTSDSLSVEQKATKGKKKYTKKSTSKDNKKNSDSGKPTPQIERLKKYIRLTGIRISCYSTLWGNCKTNKAKTQKLLEVLTDAGLKGKPTIEKCKRLHAKRERKEEVNSLDKKNIISSENGRPKRNTSSLYLHAPPKPIEENRSTKIFSRIQNLFDSDGSD